MKINSLLSTKSATVITIGPGQKVSLAISMMASHNIGALVVTNNVGRVVGIISERDIVRMAAQREDVTGLAVADVMTRKVVIGVPEDDIISVAHTMTEKRFRHLPVIDEGRLVGIISIGDILKAQRDQYRGEIDTLETQIMADQE
jgi:CBS domain-containing protein